MLHIFNGQMNSGKTFIMAYETFLDYLDGRIIYSNIPLNFPHILINRDFVFELGEKQPILKNSSFLLDELWIWLDCRDSKSNTIATYFFLQSSKDDINIRISAQSFSQNDKRIKENFHKLSICKRVIKIDNEFLDINSEKRFLPKDIQDKLYIQETEFKRKNNINGTLVKSAIRRIKADCFFSLYDTTLKVRK
jgi:hypothetical protein